MPISFIQRHNQILRLLAAILLAWYLLMMPRRLFDAPCSTVVTDRHGELLGARIAADGQWRFPPSEVVPYKFGRCIVAFEDRYFYRHFGVNPFSTARALWQNINAGRNVSGGSTITMQLVRLSRGKKRTVLEKIVEMTLATRLECHYSKRDILSLYASYAPFGGNVVGIEAASWRYYGHSAAQLSWAEAATLAVLPNAPSVIHPARNRRALLAKRDRLLLQLHRQGVIDALDYELALSEPLPSEPLPLPNLAPHLTDRLSGAVSATIDKTLQQRAEALLEQWHNDFARNDIRNLAALIVDIQSSEVLAYCGNVDYASGSSANQVDIIRSPRSTGSILKPLLYYAALDDGTILPHTLLPDIPLNINGFAPQNFNMQYDGAVSASKVISRSLNVPSVWLLREYGVPRFYDFLKSVGITTLRQPPSHYGLSLILGGAEATLWDVTGTYTAMAQSLNGEQERRPLTVEAESGGSARHRRRDDRPYRPAAVWQVFEALKEANRPEEIDRRYITSLQPVAWKTGTSYGFRDAWAVGVTKRFAIGVWVGNANGEGKPELTGARTAAPVMFALFNLLPTSEWFEKPAAEFTEATVCQQSGHLANRFCNTAVRQEILPEGLQTQACPYHITLNLTPDRKYRIYNNCIGTIQNVVQESWFTLPPVWEWYYRQHHPEYKPLPPLLNGCGEPYDSPMAFIYPQNYNTKVFLPKQLDGSDGGITLELAHKNNNATVFWHLDENYEGTTTDFHKYTVFPTRGKHVLTVVDNEGNALSVTLNVE
jgi:penicillin-binding protein 1C